MQANSPPWLRYIPALIRQRIEGRTNLLAIIHNTGWLCSDRAMRMVMSVLVGAWVARYLGPSQFGELAYVVAFVAFFSVISQLGLDAVAIRDMARNKQYSPAILGTVLRLRFISGFLCWGAAIAGMALLRPGDTQSLVLTMIIASAVVFQAADSIDLWFQSQTQSKRTVLAKAVSYLMAGGLKVALILAKAPLIAFAIVGFIEVMLSAFALWVAYRRFPTPFRWEWDTEWAAKLLRESWPYLLSGLAIIIYMRIDQIMLREMVGEHELGIYSAALPLSTAWYFIPMVIYISVAPTIACRKQTDPVGYERAITQLFSMMWWVMLPLSAAIALVSLPLVALLYGEAYQASAAVLAIHVFSNVPVALGVVMGIWVVNERRNTLSLYKTTIGAASNVLLNLILIPNYGAQGAAIASLISFSIADIFSNIFLAPKIFRLQFSSLVGR